MVAEERFLRPMVLFEVKVCGVYGVQGKEEGKKVMLINEINKSKNGKGRGKEE